MSWSKTLVNLTVLLVIPISACSTESPALSGASDVQTSTVVSTTSVPAVTQTSENLPETTEPPEPPAPILAVGICNARTLEQRWFDPSTGVELLRRENVSAGIYDLVDALRFEFKVNSSDAAVALCGTNSVALGSDRAFRGVYSADFTEAVGLGTFDDGRGVVLASIERPGAHRLAVEMELETDFGGEPADAAGAVFTPSGDELVWLESSDDTCRTFQAPVDDLPIARADIERYLIQELDGACSDRLYFAHRFDQVFALLYSDVDLAGNNIELPEESWSPPDPPASSRFSMSPVFAASDGRFFFTALDRDTREWFLYSWDGTDNEPVLIVALDTEEWGHWYPLGEATYYDGRLSNGSVRPRVS